MPEINLSSEKTVKPVETPKPKRQAAAKDATATPVVAPVVAPAPKSNRPHGGELDINLMSEEFRGHTEEAGVAQKKIMNGALLGLLVGGLAVGGALGYAWYADQQLQDVKSQITAVNSQIAELEANRRDLSATQSVLTNVKKVLDDHSYWSKFFEGLEANTIPDVVYTGANTGVEGQVNLAAFAKDYTAVGKQLVALREVPDFAKSVTVNSANAVLDLKGKSIGVNFDMTIEVSPAFIKANTVGTATTPTTPPATPPTPSTTTGQPAAQ